MAAGYFKHGVWRIDLAMARRYALGQAYQISLRERPRGGTRSGIGFGYGGTPLATMRRIMVLSGAARGETFLDLGSGTGRFVMIAERLFGMDAAGVEWMPTFVRNARLIARPRGLHCRFDQGDLLTADWSRTDLLYSVTTAFTDEDMRRFSAKCGEMLPGARMVTVSRRPEHPGLRQVAAGVYDFSWGPGSVFVQQRTTDG